MVIYLIPSIAVVLLLLLLIIVVIMRRRRKIKDVVHNMANCNPFVDDDDDIIINE